VATTIVIDRLASGPVAPQSVSPSWPNVLHTKIADVVKKMGRPPWSQRIIADERQLVTLIASPPGGGNRPHWHREFDEWWVVLAGRLQWELTGNVVVSAGKDDIVWVPRGTVHQCGFTDDGPREWCA
jgi:mannose-6-phosphate isomerase-like protein (cupin superfamily)